MSEPGRLVETYVAAIQHDLVDLPEDTFKLGVVRQPTSWFHPRVDENEPALGPPEELFEAFKTRDKHLQTEGLSDEDAHNSAWEDVNYDQRYLSYLRDSEAARQAIQEVIDRVTDGTDVGSTRIQPTRRSANPNSTRRASVTM